MLLLVFNMYTDDSIALPTIARITDTIVEYINGDLLYGQVGPYACT